MLSVTKSFRATPLQFTSRYLLTEKTIVPIGEDELIPWDKEDQHEFYHFWREEFLLRDEGNPAYKKFDQSDNRSSVRFAHQHLIPAE